MLPLSRRCSHLWRPTSLLCLVEKLLFPEAKLTGTGVQTGGILWFSDLSIADPTYALPVVAAMTMIATIELGGDTGSSTTSLCM